MAAYPTGMRLHKYHALGNDYLVLTPRESPATPTSSWIERVCHRHYGPGSDGLLYGPLPSAAADFRLRIYNPDGSEAEKSGNGLRIFARFLFEQKLVGQDPFSVETLGGKVYAQVLQERTRIRIDMGRVSFLSTDLPMAGPPREVMLEPMEIDGQTLRVCCASIGNPHCVVPHVAPTADLARRFGPLLEKHPWFPQRTNVQFLEVLDRRHLRIEIWERGAGYTLASGSSSSASAAVARKLGWIDESVTVQMPGGSLEIEISPEFAVTMTGPVTKVGTFELAPEAVETVMGSGVGAR